MANPISNARWSDAWLLLAIYYATDNDGSSLARVIAAADAIQHAVLTWEEIDGGIFRLTNAGYVVLNGEDVNLTPEARRAIAALKSRDVLATQDEVVTLLGAPPWSPDRDETREPGQPEVITIETYDAAVAQYTSHPARTLEGR